MEVGRVDQTRRQARQHVRRAVAEREALDLRAVHDVAAHRRRLQDRRRGGDHHDLFHPSRLQLQIELEVIAHPDGDAFVQHRLEAFELRFQRVDARVEVDDLVEAFRVGGHHRGEVGLHVGGDDGDAGENASAAVGDTSADSAAKVLGESGVGEDESECGEDGTEQAGSFHGFSYPCIVILAAVCYMTTLACESSIV